MIRRTVGYAATAALAAGVFATGWERQHPDKVPSTGCEALKPNGETATIVSYPLGKIAVQFQKDKLLFNKPSETEGWVVNRDDQYILTIDEGFPENLANNYIPEFSDTPAKLILVAPSLGKVGLTEQCIQSGRVVSLPIQP